METKARFELREVIRKIFIVLSLALLILSIAGLYMALNELISIWIGYKYAPIYRALLNLAVLVLAIYTLTQLIKHED